MGLWVATGRFLWEGKDIGSKYAGIIVDVYSSSVDKIFHYLVPPSLADIEVGRRVAVPFGARRVEGYILELLDRPPDGDFQLREIVAALDDVPVLNEEAISVARWISHNYGGCLAQALQLFLPPGNRYGRERVQEKRQLVVALSQPEQLTYFLQQLPENAYRQRLILEYLAEHGATLAAEVCRSTGATYHTLRALEKRGWVTTEKQRINRRVEWDHDPRPIHSLNAEQLQAIHNIDRDFRENKRPVLLYGVTGSGKTEVYMELIERAVKQGKQALVLVPEISLTPQTLSRFQNRFAGKLAVLHSGLSPGERFDQWWQIKSGQASIVIGARSAVFAPLTNIGVIVLDEEHESTYKQEEGAIRYHAREVAAKRAAIHNALLVLGSATPSIETYHRALTGEFGLARLSNRVGSSKLPKVELVDMRQEFAANNRSIFSRQLAAGLQQALNRQEQVLILLNRRGFSTFLLCRECGHVVECPNCQVSLTYHQPDERLKCHYCGFQQVLPKVCPQCASKYLRRFGCGTQQVEEYVRKEYPGAVIARMDADTTRRKGAHQSIISRFRNKQANVLIGTQMIAKGLDFPDVTLVGVLSADLSLNFPDFRAAERTFQLLTQVSGRAGRGEKPGQVIIQCYDPKHYAVQAAAQQDYARFFRREISFRRETGFPPFGYLYRILFTGPHDAVRHAASEWAQRLNELLSDEQVLGPFPAPLAKIKGRFRWHILVKAVRPVNQVVRQVKGTRQVNVVVDIDPIFLM